VTATARRLAKRVLAHGLVRTGWWDVALGSWARRDATVVLTYHRVLETPGPALDYSQPGMVVTAATFERQLSFLERHFDVVPLGALLGDTSRRPGGRPRCVITFDDGWRDNHDLALPILRKHGLPATIYLTTDFIGTDRAFWHTELIYLFLSMRIARFLRDDRVLADYPEAVRSGVRQCLGSVVDAVAVDGLIETLKAACDEDVIQRLLTTLARVAGLERPLFRGRRFFLDWDQVRHMAAHGFEIASHGCSHRIMTRLTVEEAREELTRSRAEIERRLGREVVHFAFPNENANRALIDLVARAGYRTACVGHVEDGVAGPGLLTLRRAGMHEGVGIGGSSHDDAVLSLSLFRAPKSRPA
jgi:peptidoglycan/xylan/chitin deacetylase (PgdA/CDA1 family)